MPKSKKRMGAMMGKPMMMDMPKKKKAKKRKAKKAY